MRVQITPRRVEVIDNSPFTVTVTVTNTASIIGGYHLRVLGADPSWVTMEAENLSLFPDASANVAVTVAIPAGVGAGDRRIAVQVREVTPPHAIAVAEIELMVPPRDAISMVLSPLTVVCGKTGRFSVAAENTGNTTISAVPVGLDPEDKVRFEFIPPVLELAPGEHVIADLRTTARRRWFGTPVIRPFALAVANPETVDRAGPPLDGTPLPAGTDGQTPGGPAGTDLAVPEPPPAPPKPLANGTMMQKPRLGRGLLSLLSLLLAVSVFAVVITIALSRLVGVSTADRDLALQVAAARNASAGAGGSSELGGTVNLLTDGAPAPGVAVQLFSAGDLTQPLISTATNNKGAWAVTSLPAGSYKVLFQGAGFVEVWYPNALTGADAQAVQLNAGQKMTNLAVTLGGLPANISGQVMGTDVAGAVLTVQVPEAYLKPVAKSRAPTGSAGGSPGAPPTVTAQPVPPATGAAAITTPGLAPSTRNAPPPGGLRAGDTRVASGPVALPAADPATDPGTAPPTAAGQGSTGGSTAPAGGVLRTIPLSSDGMFTLADLPSPAVYDLVVTKQGFATDTQRVDLSGGESRTGVLLVLRTGDGLIAGTVTGPNGPLGNAVITAKTGNTTVQTVSLTTGTVGAFTLRGLVTPAPYTVTVTLDGYTTVTSTVTLASGQKLTGVLMSLARSTGSLSGMVTTLADGKPAPGVTVTVSAGTATTLTTVTQSGDSAGSWTVGNLPIPGTFTITFARPDLQPQTVSVALNTAGALTAGAGGSGGIDVAMRSAYAMLSGTVTQQTGHGTVPAGEATISLSSGTETYVVTSASTPAAAIGEYQIGNVLPGTYTVSVSRAGTSPTTEIITLSAGQTMVYSPVLIQAASISGVVTSGGVPLPGTVVELYFASQYPTTVYRSTTTDAAGHYSFSAVDAPQAYVVQVRTSSVGPVKSGTIVLAASQAGVLNLDIATAAATTPAATPKAAGGSPPAASPPAPPTSGPTTTSQSQSSGPATSPGGTP